MNIDLNREKDRMQRLTKTLELAIDKFNEEEAGGRLMAAVVAGALADLLAKAVAGHLDSPDDKGPNLLAPRMHNEMAEMIEGSSSGALMRYLLLSEEDK